MKRFLSGKHEKHEIQPREKVVNKTAEEIGNIIRSGNFQGENFNKTVNYIENIIVGILESDAKLMNLQKMHHVNQLSLALAFPLFVSPEDLEKEDPEIKEIYNKNQVTRVSSDSLRRYVVLKALDGILKISSLDEFGNKKYKIGDIEINSFEDLEKNRGKLKNMYEKWKTYDIPGYKEAVEYAAKNGINTNFYE